jgi:hypothetical protein
MGARLVWFVPTRSRDARYVRAEYVRGASVHDSFVYAELDEHGELVRVPPQSEGAAYLPRHLRGLRTALQPARIPFRQDRVLDADEERFFLSLSEPMRAAVLHRSPGGGWPRVFR